GSLPAGRAATDPCPTRRCLWAVRPDLPRPLAGGDRTLDRARVLRLPHRRRAHHLRQPALQHPLLRPLLAQHRQPL
ncbi:MAG: hypothetical protein AVDCRST_MAG77-3898, partial [uncultured Chloroflexi bacterium]